MKHIILVLLISSNAYADTAVWTGKFELLSESPNGNTWLCQYKIEDRTFWDDQEIYCEKVIDSKGE